MGRSTSVIPPPRELVRTDSVQSALSMPASTWSNPRARCYPRPRPGVTFDHMHLTAAPNNIEPSVYLTSFHRKAFGAHIVGMLLRHDVARRALTTMVGWERERSRMSATVAYQFVSQHPKVPIVPRVFPDNTVSTKIGKQRVQ